MSEHICKQPTVEDPSQCVHCSRCGKYIYTGTLADGCVAEFTLCVECSRTPSPESGEGERCSLCGNLKADHLTGTGYDCPKPTADVGEEKHVPCPKCSSTQTHVIHYYGGTWTRFACHECKNEWSVE
jgi:hypothetical protein